MSEREAAARTTVARLGVDAERPGEDRVASLLAGPEAEALLAALAELGGPASAAVLVRLETGVPDRATRKAIRRALYRLRQRGVPIPEPPAAPAPVRAAGDQPEAFLTAFAGDGERLAWLVQPLAEGGSLVVYAQMHEPRGLREVSTAEIGRKRLREVRHRLEAESELRFVPADWQVVDALLVEAHERSGGEETTRSYLRVRPRIASAPPRPPAEPVSARVTAPGPEEAAPLIAGSAALLAETEFRSWHPPLAEAAPFVEELAAARESPLLLSRGAEEERVREVVRRAVQALAPPDVLARRLEGTAYVLAETARTAPARQALAVAGALRARPGSAADVPFVVAFVERVLGQLVAVDTARREEAQRDSLVISPGQFLKDRSSSHPTRTRG